MGGRLSDLSARAIRVAAAHPSSDPTVLRRMLYRYGQIPATPSLMEAFGQDDEPMIVLDLIRGRPTRTRLEADYDASSHIGWLSFSRHGRDGQLPAAKLYVSPHPRSLGSVFPAIAEVMLALKVPSFKVGRGVSGLLRPDKIVAYFTDTAQLATVAAALAELLASTEPHGVPFTRQVDHQGAVSWGIDPPPANGQPQTSWRAWICHMLAITILEARNQSREPVGFVEAHLAEQGIVAWAPVQA